MGEYRAPPGWPIVEQGLLMAHLGPVMVVRTDASIEDAGFERQLVELERAIDIGSNRIGVVYDCPHVRGLHAERRRRLGALLEEREDKLRVTTSAFALITSSPVVRGMLRAVFWLAPPPYPHVVVSTPEAAFAFVASHMRDADGAALARDYAALIARHASDEK